MATGYARLILHASPSLADAQAEAAQILSPRVEVVAVQLVNATRPVAYFVVPEGYPCCACGQMVSEQVPESEGVAWPV